MEVEERERRSSIQFAYFPGENCHLLYSTTLEQDEYEGSPVVAHLS